VVFTAHSLPVRVVAAGDPYVDEVRATASAVARAAGLPLWSGWSVAWQSAGRTPEPWLGPDVLAVIDELAASEHGEGLLVCACGFVADHLEVLYDLDIEAAGRAAERGVAFARTACVNDDPTVAAALAQRVIDTATTTAGLTA
jgi:ferrochelatase